jgi:P-type Ca2+ transporter type 2C
MIGWPLPLGVIQILWLSLITDIFPAMALALEPSAPDVMKRPPRDPAEPLMTPRFGWLYGTQGEGLRHAVTVALMTLALAQVFQAFNARSQTRPALSRLFTNA